MTKEEVKQWIRNQIDSSIKRHYNDNIFYLHYNNSYVRALKLSTITGQPVNKENFKGGEDLFGFDTNNKEIQHYSKISNYLYNNYSKVNSEYKKIIIEVFNEYEEE